MRKDCLPKRQKDLRREENLKSSSFRRRKSFNNKGRLNCSKLSQNLKKKLKWKLIK